MNNSPDKENSACAEGMRKRVSFDDVTDARESAVRRKSYVDRQRQCAELLAGLGDKELDAVTAFVGSILIGAVRPSFFEQVAGAVGWAQPQTEELEAAMTSPQGASGSREGSVSMQFDVHVRRDAEGERVIIKPRKQSLSADQIRTIERQVLGIFRGRSDQTKADDEGQLCLLVASAKDGGVVKSLEGLTQNQSDAAFCFASALAGGLLDVSALKFLAGIVEGSRDV